jgi:hypothetical protein
VRGPDEGSGICTTYGRRSVTAVPLRPILG